MSDTPPIKIGCKFTLFSGTKKEIRHEKENAGRNPAQIYQVFYFSTIPQDNCSPTFLKSTAYLPVHQRSISSRDFPVVSGTSFHMMRRYGMHIRAKRKKVPAGANGGTLARSHGVS